ncbi:hypothetical protein N4E61_15160, partial [Staphylococcus aureus]|nr:hypothetical protein [Staphylococcus aureus]
FVTERQIPVLYDFPAGHGNPQATIPLGVEVELVAAEKNPHLCFREAGVKLVRLTNGSRKRKRFSRKRSATFFRLMRSEWR